MRVMVIVKATKSSEAGVLPSEELLTRMAAYNEQLFNAGILVDGEGLQPSSRGKRIAISPEGRRVIDGPFFEAEDFGEEMTRDLRAREARLRVELDSREE